MHWLNNNNNNNNIIKQPGEIWGPHAASPTSIEFCHASPEPTQRIGMAEACNSLWGQTKNGKVDDNYKVKYF